VADEWGIVDEREARIGRNEALFRHVNERLEDVNDAFGPMAGDFEIVCECGDLDCDQRIDIRREAYEELRADPLLFAIVDGHVAVGVEDVIEQRKGYSVVRKRPGTPAAFAAASNPADR
jgi:hypothetical protein